MNFGECAVTAPVENALPAVKSTGLYRLRLFEKAGIVSILLLQNPGGSPRHGQPKPP
jgi:hypothetical protein